MDIVGKRVGRYEIQEHIGEGGMAQVYRAYDPDIHRTGALKMLKEEHCNTEEHMRRFIQEGKAAGALTHPNIVTIYDVGSVEDAPYIMMELLEGESLGSILGRGERLPLDVILDISAQIASALDYAHSRGVVHRDMKPDNVILSGNYKSVKIADFGIARIEENKDATQLGMMLGTPRYMSPEQAGGSEVDGRADLFALGVILYEMVTGCKAFDAQTMTTLIMQIVNQDPTPIRKLNKDAPVGLQKIVNKLMRKSPEKRFQTGAELRDALHRELASLREDVGEGRKYLPMHIKWTAIMTGAVAAIMALSSVLIYRSHAEAVTRQAIDSGISLSRFVAVQAAIPVLGEDWISLESMVQDASARQTFRYLIISDHEGVVRGATDESLIGHPWNPENVEAVMLEQDPMLVSDVGDVYNFRLPVLFQDTMVGRVDVGLSTAALDYALQTTATMLIILGFVVMLAVSLVIYIFNSRISRNIKLSTGALSLFRPDHLEVRISKERSSEFGDLFRAFNQMADSVENYVNTNSPDSACESESEPSPKTAETDTDHGGSVDDTTVVLRPTPND